jgi:hypothetical protein
MFDYEVMTEQEAMKERFQLMKDGEYDAVVDKAEARISQNSGNPMMELNLSVFDNAGKAHPVRDFLVFTKNMMWKAIHCADSAGLQKEYDEKKFCPELIQGQRVRVMISTQEGGVIPQDKLKGKPQGSRYPDKNVVDDYVKKDNQKPLSKAVNADDDIFNDSIPF